MKAEKVRALARLKARELTKKEIKKIAGGIKTERGPVCTATTQTLTNFISYTDTDERGNCIIL